MGLESLSQGPGGASCHNFAQGVGLSFGSLWSCELTCKPFPRGPFHPEMRVVTHREMRSALPRLLRFALSAPQACIKKIFLVAFDPKGESGPSNGNSGTFLCVC